SATSSPRRRRPQSRRRVLDGVDDRLIAGAATDVAGELAPDLFPARARGPLEQVVDRHQDPRRAVAALEREVLVKRRLDGVELAIAREPLDGPHLGAVELHREEEARAHRFALEQHRARAAHPVLAAEVRPGQLEVLAEEVGQALAGLHEPLRGLAVDGEPHHAPLRVLGQFASPYLSSHFTARLALTAAVANGHVLGRPRRSTYTHVRLASRAPSGLVWLATCPSTPQTDRLP